MMSTLFIGPQDWVFRWKDHEPLLIGLVVGMIVSGFAVYMFLDKRRRLGEPYEAVVMNEIKSKVLD